MKYNQRNWINIEASKNGDPIWIRVIEKMDPLPRYSCLMVVAFSFDSQSDPVSALERVEQMEVELDKEFIAHARGFKPPPLGGAFRLPAA